MHVFNKYYIFKLNHDMIKQEPSFLKHNIYNEENDTENISLTMINMQKYNLLMKQSSQN